MMKTAKVIIEDETNAKVLGLTPVDMVSFHDQYGFYTESYFFHPKYQLKRWDGKIRYFSKSGVTYVQLLPEIVKKLRDLDYKIELTDKRKYFKLDIPKIDKDYFKDSDIVLGDHQVKAINAVTQDDHKGIIFAGTGAGKTIITAALADLYVKYAKTKVIIIVPSEDLIKQTYNELNTFPIDVGMYYSKVKSIDNDVIVSTWQSLQNNKSILKNFYAVMVDECHGARGDVLKKMLVDNGKHIPIRIGLTGSIPTNENELMAIFTALGDLKSVVKAKSLIDQGWLAKLNLHLIEFEEGFKEEWEEFKKLKPENSKVNYSTFKNKYMFPDYNAEKRFLKGNIDRLYFIGKMIEEAARENGNTFVLVNTIDFAKKLTSKIEGAFFLDSKTKNREELVYSKFADNDGLIVVATFSLASVGLNIKRIFNLFMIDGGKSSIRSLQTIGRALRKAEDKDEAQVFDVCSNIKYSKRHFNTRKKIYNKQKHKFKEIKVNYEEENPRDIVKTCLSDKDTLKKEVLQ